MTETTQHSTRTPGRTSPAGVIAVLTLATLATVTVELAPSGLLPHMSTDLGVPLGAVGLLVTVWALTIALGSIPLVRATSRIPRRTLLSAALTVTAVANAATALAPNFPVAFLGRLVAAGAHGLFWALVVTFVASLVRPEKLGTALSIVLAGPAFAGLVALPAATAAAGAVGWRPTLLALSVLLLAIATAVWVVVGGPEGSSDAPERPGRWDHSARQVLTVAVGGSLVIAAHFAVFTYIAPIVVDLGGFAPSSIAAILLVFGVANAVGVVGAGVVSDRYPHAAAPAAAALLALGVLILRLGGNVTPVFAIGVVLWGIATGAFPPILQARVLRVSTVAFRPLAGGVVITAMNLGIAAGALIGATLLSSGAGTVVIAGFIAASSGVAVLLFTGSRRDSSTSGGSATEDPAADLPA
ncbi:MFS transporter [Rhodococcus artemisiae]|uniref:MFS transporter n=1 Tax=Rhodococcus artemisiae TaxID=714159 RepID=A0ABU7LDK5_9NOCA|nr:MFS transporter [Rhodococcus artemisiae]MEE2059634.1 MFS transporter [Rhodococcus artemisiae]